MPDAVSKRRPDAESLLARTKRLLRRSGLRARKGLGQHFLVDSEVLRTIVEAAELMPSDTVVEVGPGLGILTAELAARAGRVIAVEVDGRLAAILKEAQSTCHNVEIVNDDILRVDPTVLLGETGQESETPTGHGYKVVANLPYYIAAPVLRHFLEASVKPEMMVVMIQKEVAETIAARPGRMTLLSVSVQLYGDPVIVGNVPAGSFYPAPEVDSAVLKIVVPPRPRVVVSDERGFFGLVRAGFTASRKQLANSLAHGLGTARAEMLPLLERAGIETRRRAETLSVEEWARLHEVFVEAGRKTC